MMPGSGRLGLWLQSCRSGCCNQRWKSYSVTITAVL
uniref:Uncharacterized protein n=1 Tax=Anguilla anguilla TaxID=7936 RepID=A0A0E9XGJ5_ANGAN